jgi:hypothetical protein
LMGDMSNSCFPPEMKRRGLIESWRCKQISTGVSGSGRPPQENLLRNPKNGIFWAFSPLSKTLPVRLKGDIPPCSCLGIYPPPLCMNPLCMKPCMKPSPLAGLTWLDSWNHPRPRVKNNY